MLYRYTETLPCWVTFARRIEAPSKEEAIQAAMEGGGDLVDTDIGDIVDGYDLIQDIEELSAP